MTMALCENVTVLIQAEFINQDNMVTQQCTKTTIKVNLKSLKQFHIFMMYISQDTRYVSGQRANIIPSQLDNYNNQDNSAQWSESNIMATNQNYQTGQQSFQTHQ